MFVRIMILLNPVKLVVPSSGILFGISSQVRVMSHGHPFSFISDGICSLEEKDIDLQLCAFLFFFVFSRRVAEQPEKLSQHFFSPHHLFLLSTKEWSAKLTIYEIEWIPIKIMVSLGIKLEYFIFMSRFVVNTTTLHT